MRTKKNETTPETTTPETTAPATTAPLDNAPKPTPDEAGWEEVLVVSGAPIRDGLEEGEVWEGIYLGAVLKITKYGAASLHLMLTAGGVEAMWGGVALNEGLGRAIVGRATLVTGRGYIETERGQMRLVRIQQRGRIEPEAPVIRDARAEADAVYAALGLDADAAEQHLDQHAAAGARVFGDLS